MIDEGAAEMLKLLTEKNQRPQPLIHQLPFNHYGNNLVPGRV